MVNDGLETSVTAPTTSSTSPSSASFSLSLSGRTIAVIGMIVGEKVIFPDASIDTDDARLKSRFTVAACVVSTSGDANLMVIGELGTGRFFSTNCPVVVSRAVISAADN